MEASSSKGSNSLRGAKIRSSGSRKNQQRTASADNNNSTDDENPNKRFNHSSSTGVLGTPSLQTREENNDPPIRKRDGHGGFGDSENDNLTSRLCSLSKLSLHGNIEGRQLGIESAESLTEDRRNEERMAAYATPTTKSRNMSYPSFPESDFSDVRIHSAKSASTLHHDADPSAFETMDDSSEKRRRRRRKGPKGSTKRMAVDVTPPDKIDGPEDMGSYSIRAAERPGPSHKKKMGKTVKVVAQDSLDSCSMKRKRTVTPIVSGECDSSNGDSNHKSLGAELDVGRLSLNSPLCVDDQEMKSEDDDFSSFESPDDDDDDDDERGGEADDEQSDWVFDEWSSNSKKSEESASCRKKRLMKILRSYNDMISANAPGSSSSSGLQHSKVSVSTREIRAGKRRVHSSKPGVPTKSVLTANEEVSKFLQDPTQSQLRLKPVSAEETVRLSQLASLYSLRMDYCNNDPPQRESIIDMESTLKDSSNMHDETSEITSSSNSTFKLFPVLTKTSNTTQMDKGNIDPSTSSPVGAEGSSSSNVSSIFCPTYSDVDSRTSESKRIKK